MEVGEGGEAVKPGEGGPAARDSEAEAGDGGGRESRENKEPEETKKKSKGSKALRMGAEGDDVKELQEALMRLGFYLGEEDMDYSGFSTGTNRAVKTWQASVGAKEDGVMTSQLLEMLLYGKQVESSSSGEDPDGSNGAAMDSVTEVSEIRQTIGKGSNSEVEISQQRVFLLGEYRREEPGRLVNGKNQIEKSKQGGSNARNACLVEGWAA
ncbi:hypothetical protein MLD38_035983 [Melastoma candidum]|uniref:Uncharacterized protein n=1 Tax=Melastoma candidum TaxID=119954 RepID=A0ACB9LIN9_9MYRT|nr:hypothetical protein MLD38_035983 [Melastoma candidum]